MREFDNFRNSSIYENINEKDYSMSYYKIDDKKVKGIKEKYQKY